MRPGALCLFGFGFSARAIAHRMAQKGWRIIATTRSPETADAIGALGYQPVLANPAEPSDHPVLIKAAERADAWLGCAPPADMGDPFLPILTTLSPKLRWVGYLSTTGVYGDRNGGWAFEWQAPTPGQGRSIRRAAAETQWAKLNARIFRLSGIYGPGRSAFDRLDRKAPVFDKPGHVFSRIHVEDIASAVERALQRPEIEGVFNMADDWPDTQANVLRGAAEIAGRPAPTPQAFDPETVSEMQASFYSECRRVSNARAKAALGWRPAYPSWKEGLSAIWNTA